MRTYGSIPGGTSGEESACQCRRHNRCRFNPWIRKIPLEKKMAIDSSIFFFLLVGGQPLYNIVVVFVIH